MIEASVFGKPKSLVAALAWALICTCPIGCTKPESEGHFEEHRSIVKFAEDSATVDDIARVVRSPSMRHAVYLWLTGTRVGDRGVVEIARSPHLAGIERLRLFDSEMSNIGLGALAAARDLAPQALQLGRGSFDARGLRVLLESPVVSAVDTFEIFATPIGIDGARALLASPVAKRLRTLRWMIFETTDDVIRALIETKSMPRLEHLEISGGYWRSTSLAGLTDTSRLPALKTLWVMGMAIDPDVLAALEAARPELEIVSPPASASKSAPGLNPASAPPAAAPSSPRPAPARPAGAATSPADPPPRGD